MIHHPPMKNSSKELVRNNYYFKNLLYTCDCDDVWHQSYRAQIFRKLTHINVKLIKA